VSQPLAPRGHDAARREATPFGRSVQTCPAGTGHQQTGCHSPVPTHIHIHMQTCRCSTHTHMHTHTRVHTHARIQHMHACTHTHAHTHTHREREGGREREKAHVSLQKRYNLGVEQLIWLGYLHRYRLATVRSTLSRAQRHRQSMQ